MAEPSPIYTQLDTDLFTAGNFLRESVLIEQFAQNIQRLIAVHNHDGDPGDGGDLDLASPVALFFYGAAAGS